MILMNLLSFELFDIRSQFFSVVPYPMSPVIFLFESCAAGLGRLGESDHR